MILESCASYFLNTMITSIIFFYKRHNGFFKLCNTRLFNRKMACVFKCASFFTPYAIEKETAYPFGRPQVFFRDDTAKAESRMFQALWQERFPSSNIKSRGTRKSLSSFYPAETKTVSI